MPKENLILGGVGIVLGIGILIKTGAIIPALIPALIGIALILFHKEEDKIEKRKDTTKSTKSKEVEASRNPGVLGKDIKTKKIKK